MSSNNASSLSSSPQSTEQSFTDLITALRKEIDDLRRQNDEHRETGHNLHVVSKQTAVTFYPYEKLIEYVPSAEGRHFFNSRIPEDDKIYDMADFHLNANMSYTAPLTNVPSQSGISKFNLAIDKELAQIQSMLAHCTRPIDTYASEIVNRGNPDEEWSASSLAILHVIRVMLERIATHITRTREQVVLRSLGHTIKPIGSTPPILEADKIAESRKFTEVVRESSKRLYRSDRSYYKGKHTYQPHRRNDRYNN
ncbi:hypothetical protein BX616_003594 [Lobosporangium transversale]|uniref:Uncharacterized protein n=1 Tax=Lobosporangium transversale TaxID=64571 RepID=A0A1Y2G5X7_9FUNG|nr:hypothetical protein BCR41DRAFT_231676 [Lobosporangium transversale]KAF9898802.1 hypothetical protein BX616_003594 [Lobosporangium transversale]ORY96099.1 hypothetical protein BCR41DRAFT_231676 [Lobosporangium transversale]|eukprot:XP_021875518.1 hypothetical protein BCR41DRAFT_231676 [Lobosporangium transversale]